MAVVKQEIREKISKVFSRETQDKVRTIFPVHFSEGVPLVYGVLGNNGKWLGLAEFSRDNDEIVSIWL